VAKKIGAGGKRGLMSGVFRGELIGGKLDKMSGAGTLGDKARSTAERDIVGGGKNKVSPRVTGPERQRLINETNIFWDTYFKILPKYEKEKDEKGKSKTEEIKQGSLVQNVLEKSDKAKTSGGGGFGHFLTGMLMRGLLPMLLLGLKGIFIFALVAVVGATLKKFYDDWKADQKQAEEWHATDVKGLKFQQEQWEKSQVEADKQTAAGDPLGAQRTRVMADATLKMWKLKERSSEDMTSGWSRFWVNIGVSSDVFGEKMEKVQDKLEKDLKIIDAERMKDPKFKHEYENDPANKETAANTKNTNSLLNEMNGNLRTLVASNGGGGFPGQAPPHIRSNPNSGTYSEDTGIGPIGEQISSRMSFMGSANSINVPPVIA
tara:strand:- start:306 stop:1433 length:1128 start_codon:yes stop_codon:yes gene_type:complete